jgi:hypothetical protein
MSADMTWEEWRVVASKYEAMVANAVPGLKAYDVSVHRGEGGLPHRLEVRGDLADRHEKEDGKAYVVAKAFTFFDGGDLKRIAMALGRARREHFEARAARLAEMLAQAKADAEAQAGALAALEREAPP